MKKFLAVLASLAMMVSLTGCGGGSDENVFYYALDTEASSLDSTVATDGASFTAIHQFIDGLTCRGEDGEITLALAEDAETSEDGLTWTFKIRDDANWENGDPVTANDFVYAWTRLLKNGGEYSSMFGPDGANIVNATAIMEGTMEADQLGVEATDDKTLVVHLVTPCAYFLELMNFAVFYPQNEAFVEEVGEDKYATSADNLLSCGAFKVTDYQQGSRITYEKNEEYYDADSVQLDGVEIYQAVESDTGTMGFENGDYDFVPISFEMVDKYRDSDAYYTYQQGYMHFIMFNYQNEQLQNINLRRAISLAIDRNDFAKNVLKDGSVAAQGFVPSNLSESSAGTDFRDDSGSYLSYDLTQAQQYLDAALQELGVSEITLELLYGNNEAPNDTCAEYLESALSKLNGLKIEMKVETKTARLDDMTNSNFDLAVTRWGPDFADPTTYLTLYNSTNSNNDGKYSNPEFDAILEQITNENNVDARWQLMIQAEKMLMDDCAMVPIFEKGGTALMNTDYEGLVIRVTGPNVLKYVHKAK